MLVFRCLISRIVTSSLMAKFTGCQKYFLFIDVCDILENKEYKKNKEYIDSDDDSITGNNDEIDSQGDDIDDF